MEKRKKMFKALMAYKDAPELSEEFMAWLENESFFAAPASTKYHGAYAGGLFNHSYRVTMQLLKLTNALELKWQNPRSPFIVGMFHDLCKIDQYVPIEGTDGAMWEYNDECAFKGHGDKSVILLSQFFQLTEEEILCIRYHMGAYETEDWDGYDRAIRKYETVLWTHTADMHASKVQGV